MLNFKLSPIVKKKLEEKYPDIDITTIASDIFSEIANATFEDGACNVGGFGTFVCFKTFSPRIGRFIVKFKYLISRQFKQRIRLDDLLLSKVKEAKPNPEFKEERVKKESIIETRNFNKKMKETGICSKAKDRARKRQQLETILDILSKDETEED